MSRRLTPDAYHAIAALRGFQWLGPEVSNNRTKTRWLCPKGHVFETRYSEIQKGGGCIFCANERAGERCRHNPEKYHQLASERGFQWIGEYPSESHQPTLWQCPQGHEWKAAYGDIRDGHGCPICYDHTPRTEEHYHKLAQERGFKLVGSIPANVVSKAEWECSKGHRWKIPYHDLQGCPFCYGNSPKTSGDYIEAAKHRGFFWLGPLPKGVNYKSWWQCQQGHKWEATYTNIVFRKSDCPLCKEYVNGQPVSKLQRRIHEMIGGELNYPVKRYRIDIALFVDDVKIAIEYDGSWWHKPEAMTVRDNHLLSNGWRILHIKSGRLVPSKKRLQAHIDRLVAGETFLEIILSDWYIQ